MDIEKKEYNNIFVPIEDVVDLSGPEILKNFESKSDCSKQKNLIVLPQGMISSLGKLIRSRNSYGAEDFLNFLDHNQDKLNFDESNEKFNIYNLLDRLDVAVLKDEYISKEKYLDLEKKINSYWTILDQDEFGSRPRFISNTVEDRLNLYNRGLLVQKPEFLLEEADIVKKGILVASTKFTNKIFSSPNLELSLDEAIDLLDPEDGTLYPNQFIHIKGEYDQYAKVIGDIKRSSSGKIVGYDNVKVKLLSNQEHNKKIKIGSTSHNDILGIKPLDMEQYLAFQHGLFDPTIEAFFLTGSQGSGKTLLSYVAAIDQILWYDEEIAKARGYGLDSKENQRKSRFRNVVLLKPNTILGDRDIGFLPGDMFEKLRPHLEPYIDAHKESIMYEIFRFEELLAHPRWDNQYFSKRSSVPKINKSAYLPGNSEAFEMTYSGVMRGRSFKETLVLIDEAQNFTPYEVKTIFERMGPGSKLIVMGDPFQVDNKSCSRDINGLTHSIKHYLSKPYSSLIHLQRNYRSQMSEDSLSWKVYSN